MHVAMGTVCPEGRENQCGEFAQMDASQESHTSVQQGIYESASTGEQERYLELMRHDPIAGMAYLDALGLMQQRNSTSLRSRTNRGEDGEGI